jgi:hypothetical protein
MDAFQQGCNNPSAQLLKSFSVNSADPRQVEKRCVGGGAFMVWLPVKYGRSFALNEVCFCVSAA